ncbi:glycosyltransferase [Roseospira marina]|uniref:Glycosyltransferase n=1 Tax=Roseospira marina TaxID=140057 RepID=A0A5M6I7N6_9PROT|nr:class I SAM-dependent methyltransferase [Roseospira marina]KAA5604163.1 glycosyltransferase [Roseospira marina]MBB4315739.1 GT2 family glycosyltransferase [Roseospira marina]MBB5088906.1 GT2 family glycosyltransferase [Roseospira marina]
MSIVQPTASTETVAPGPEGLFPFDVVRTLPLPPLWQSRETRAWQGHIPFARWLLTQTRPNTLVELGVHRGDSYCTFCETIVAHGLPTRLWGVDTWQGDEHAGHYGDVILGTLRAHHDPRYDAFSTLVRALFADAARDFAPGSLDIVHIDGLHTYDAARDDFETFLPKMSAAGVMLFHDISEYHSDFGVWRLWQELTDRYPSFTFTHSSGLGVLAVGTAPPPAIQWLTGLPEDEAAAVRQFFQAMGDGLQNAASGRVLEDRITWLNARLETQAESQYRLQSSLNVTVDTMTGALRRAYEDVGPYVRQLEFDVAQRGAEVERLQVELDAVRGDLNAVLRSSSWKLTAPLRTLAGGGAVRGYAKALILRVLHRVPGGEAILRARADLVRRMRGAGAVPAVPDLSAAKEALRQRTDADLRALLEGEGRVRLPSSARPSVSVVLVLWNQAALTLACLRGLETEFGVPLEVVIVNNASTDETGALLERVDGARVIRNTDNVGFLKAVNQAVAAATGEHVLLLNNDAILRPGSLAAAVATLESDATVGAVGGRIVLPNGRLQEAGSLIWSDGSCLGYARDLPPEAGEAMFRRDVDYCSGAFLLFRRGTFNDLGGFDEAYAPAYYEEADFCMRLWAAGLRVVFEPLVVIDHYEFGSAGKSEAAIAQQRKNHALFRAKHAEALDARHEAPNLERILWARHRLPAGTERVLILDDRVPMAHLGSGFPRTRTLLQAVAESGRFVTFYPMDKPDEDWAETFEALPPGVEVAMGRGRPGLAAFLRERADYYDTIVVSRPHNMELYKAALASSKPAITPRATVIYDAEAVFAVRDLNKARVFGAGAAAIQRAEAAIGAEVALAQGAARVVSVSEGEAAHFRAAGHTDVRVLGHSLTPTPSTRAFADRRGLLFVGLLRDEDTPNVDSLVWFHREILPLFQARLEKVVEVLVAGRSDAPSVRALGQQGLTLLGPVPDLTPLYEQARVFIAPTRYAGGIPHKIHEAAARGVPVVATPLLAKQLDWRDGEHLLVGDTAQAFAEQLARLYTDEALWESIRANALARVQAECDPDAFKDRVRSILARG